MTDDSGLRVYDPAAGAWLPDAVTVATPAQWMPIVLGADLFLVGQLPEGLTFLQYVGP